MLWSWIQNKTVSISIWPCITNIAIGSIFFLLENISLRVCVCFFEWLIGDNYTCSTFSFFFWFQTLNTHTYTHTLFQMSNISAFWHFCPSRRRPIIVDDDDDSDCVCVCVSWMHTTSGIFLIIFFLVTFFFLFLLNLITVFNSFRVRSLSSSSSSSLSLNLGNQIESGSFSFSNIPTRRQGVYINVSPWFDIENKQQY